jgi:hypothetical protein
MQLVKRSLPNLKHMINRKDFSKVRILTKLIFPESDSSFSKTASVTNALSRIYLELFQQLVNMKRL